MNWKRTIKIVMAVVLCLWLVWNLTRDYAVQLTIQKYVNHWTRPVDALEVPDFSGEITDVRMRVRERVYYPVNELFEQVTMLQIYYGYCSDGQWYDMPCENYDLIETFRLHTPQPKRGWEAAAGNHMVKIGPYLLFAVACNPEMGCDDFYDSLGTQVQTCFSEYYTYYIVADGQGNQKNYWDTHTHGYGRLIENRDSIVNGNWVTEQEFRGNNAFYQWHYILVEYDSLPEDYEIHYLWSEIAINTLTKEEIDSLLGE